jgi:hypothetical protein
MLLGMATLRQQIAAERKMRALLEEGGLPQPDEVEYGHTCIRLLWHESKAVVVVDIDEPDDLAFGGPGDQSAESAGSDGDRQTRYG